MNDETPFDFIVRLILSVVPVPAIPTALKVTWPILAEWAQDEQMLTDDLRAALQARVLRALSAAGLPGKDIPG